MTQPLRQKEYQGNVIVEQYTNDTDLYIITETKGIYKLYHNGKKICESEKYCTIKIEIPDYVRIEKERGR